MPVFRHVTHGGEVYVRIQHTYVAHQLVPFSKDGGRVAMRAATCDHEGQTAVASVELPALFTLLQIEAHLDSFGRISGSEKAPVSPGPRTGNEVGQPWPELSLTTSPDVFLGGRIIVSPVPVVLRYA